MLATSTFALIKLIRQPKNKYARLILEGWTLLYSLFFILALSLQLLGILDMRLLLNFIHIALAVTSGVLIVTNIYDAWKLYKLTGSLHNVDYVWILSAGAILDLINYYANSPKLLFVLLAVLIYVLLKAFHVMKQYLMQRSELEEKETQLTMSYVMTMMSQIRSHFVFNVLNAISGMCKYDPEKADDTIVRFSRYLRNNIDIMENDKNVPFLVEIERLEDYVVLEQVRFGDRIEFTTDIEVSDFSIPTLILQPIVENSIKHGIGKRTEGGHIELKTRENDKNIIITISDDGIGFTPDALNKEKSVGLRNIRFRLYHLVGGIMDIKSNPGVGTEVTLTIPKEGIK